MYHKNTFNEEKKITVDIKLETLGYHLLFLLGGGVGLGISLQSVVNIKVGTL